MASGYKKRIGSCGWAGDFQRSRYSLRVPAKIGNLRLSSLQPPYLGDPPTTSRSASFIPSPIQGVGPLMNAIAPAEFSTTSGGPEEEGEGRIVVTEGRLDRSYRVVTRMAGEDVNVRNMTPVAQAFVRLAGASIPAPVPLR